MALFHPSNRHHTYRVDRASVMLTDVLLFSFAYFYCLNNDGSVLLAIFLRGDILSIMLAISIAASADSAPLFPIFPPALSIACSIFSVVITPKIVGTPVVNGICDIFLAVSPAT